MVEPRSRLKIGIFLALLALLLVHQRARLVPRLTLAGEETSVKLERLTPQRWWSGRFQASYDAWLARHLRLRGWLVRVDNQVGMTIFRQPPSSGTLIVLGREGVLFEKAYVDEYNRPRKLSPRRVAKLAGSLERFDSLLRRRGSRLIVVIAPGKPEIYPELLPRRHVVPGRERRRSMHEQIAPALRRSGIALIDGFDVLREERGRSDTLLYAKGGTHWNHRANAVFASRLLGVLEREAPGRFVQIDVTGSRTDREVWVTDNDLGDLLNLFWPRPWPGPQIHPVFERRAGERAVPRLLFAGDSFSLQFLAFMTEEGLMEPGESIFYFNRRIRYPGGTVEPLDPKNFDPLQALAGKDAVVLVTCDLNIDGPGFGFVDAAIRALERDQAAGAAEPSPPRIP